MPTHRAHVHTNTALLTRMQADPRNLSASYEPWRATVKRHTQAVNKISVGYDGTFTSAYAVEDKRLHDNACLTPTQTNLGNEVNRKQSGSHKSFNQ